LPANLIISRVADFLHENPPFSFLEKEDLRDIAAQITIRYIAVNTFIFQEKNSGKPEYYMLKEGAVQLSAEGRLLGECEPGDLFGVRSILSGNPYVMTAKTTADSLVYVLQGQSIKDMMASNSQAAAFFASGLAAGQTVIRDVSAHARPLEQTVLEQGKAIALVRNNPLETRKKVLTGTKEMSIQEAARLMSEWNVGSIVIVNKFHQPIGVFTDTDLRKKVVAEGRSVDGPIHKVMSSPVLTISEHTTLTDLILEMIESRMHHLVVTEDGSPKSRVVGVLTDHDVMIGQGNHPAAILKSMKRAISIQDLSLARNQAEQLIHDLLNQDMKIALITGFATRVNDLLIQKALDIGKKELLGRGISFDGIEFAWLSLGSEGRKEQLLRTDLDNAIIFADSTQWEDVQEKLVALAQEVVEVLVHCGFERCPADMMASNPKWCQPVSRWKDYFTGWINSPGEKEVMHTTIFMDFRRTWGDISLVEKLKNHIHETLGHNRLYLNYLAKNAISNPAPLGFFNHLLVEKSGVHKNEFDIKARAMMPLIDAARVLSLEYDMLEHQSTVERYTYLMDKEPQNKQLYESAAMAFDTFLKLRTKTGLRLNTSGRFIPVDQLNKLEKKILRSSFVPISEIQSLLGVRFQLSYFN
jgi:CBS domain-containing protein